MGAALSNLFVGAQMVESLMACSDHADPALPAKTQLTGCSESQGDAHHKR